MKVEGNSLRPGQVVEHKGRIWRVVKTTHVKPGKGGAFLQVELKDIRNSTKMNERFRSASTVERVRLEQKPHQFLFSSEGQNTFMDTESYEQISLHDDMIGSEQIRFLQEGMVVSVEFADEAPISVLLPATVVMEVVEADAVVKGQTAASSYKPAILDNGVRVMIPPHIGIHEKIVVNTADITYVERYKGS